MVLATVTVGRRAAGREGRREDDRSGERCEPSGAGRGANASARRDATGAHERGVARLLGGERLGIETGGRFRYLGVEGMAHPVSEQIADFAATLAAHGVGPLRRTRTTTLQV